MKKKTSIVVAGSILLILSLGAFAYFRNVEFQKNFEAPKRTAQTVQFRVGKEATLVGVINNLQYYGFIKDNDAFGYALEHTKDTTLTNQSAIKVGENTIDTQSVYSISQSMTAGELSDVLLNKGSYEDCNNGCPPGLFYPELLPGGELKPSEFEWVQTYEDCVKARGTLTSEQYKGPKKCVIEGKEFTKGKEGFETFRGG